MKYLKMVMLLYMKQLHLKGLSELNIKNKKEILENFYIRYDLPNILKSFIKNNKKDTYTEIGKHFKFSNFENLQTLICKEELEENFISSFLMCLGYIRPFNGNIYSI